MTTQSYKNHTRYDVQYHLVLFALVLITCVGAVRYLWVSVLRGEGSLYPPVLLLLLSLALVLFFLLVRVYPLKAQDRAIRAEENLRHFVLAGRLLDARLSMKQIVALRFASDAELVALAAKAAVEDMAPDAIKQAIVNWRADLYRV